MSWFIRELLDDATTPIKLPEKFLAKVLKEFPVELLEEFLVEILVMLRMELSEEFPVELLAEFPCIPREIPGGTSR